MKPGPLIVIHGVGDSPPGATLSEISQGLCPETPATTSDLLIRGVRFPRILLPGGPFNEIIEVNWSDIARPRRSALALFDYWVRIVIALLDVAAQGAGGKAGPLMARLYRASVKAGLVYCIYPALVTMLWMTVAHRYPLLTPIIGILGTVFVLGVTFYFARFSRLFLAGLAWAVTLTAMTVAVGVDLISTKGAVQIAAVLYVVGQVLSGGLLFLALVEAAIVGKQTGDQRIGRMGLLYTPFFILSAIGALIWIALLLVVWKFGNPIDFSAWRVAYARSLEAVGYDLALIEYTFALLVGAIGVGVIVVVATYWWLSRRQRTGGQSAGAFARNAMKYLLVAGAVMFGALSLVYTFFGVTERNSGLSDDALYIYGLSSLRVLPYLPLLFGPLAAAAGIVIDVLFYVVRTPSLSTAPEIRDRFRTAVDYACAKGNAPVTVAAHSQGTVVAIDVVGRAMGTGVPTATGIITAGSPLATLYDRFLGSTPETRAAADGASFSVPPRWINFFRDGDYIGAGQAREGVEEINLGTGRHTGYWKIRRLWDEAGKFFM